MRYVAYYRVSTDMQGATGLGLDAQREAVTKIVKDGDIIAEFEEIESGKRNDRPELTKALAYARRMKAVLVIAKLDRLSRNARFLLSLVESAPEGGLLFCDFPTIPAGATGKFMVTQLAAVAELEAGLISERTKAALKALKAQGRLLGNRTNIREAGEKGAATNALKASVRASNVLPVIEKLKRDGYTSLRAIAAEMTARNVEGKSWHPTQVSRILERA